MLWNANEITKNDVTVGILVRADWVVVRVSKSKVNILFKVWYSPIRCAVMVTKNEEVFVVIQQLWFVVIVICESDG